MMLRNDTGASPATDGAASPSPGTNGTGEGEQTSIPKNDPPVLKNTRNVRREVKRAFAEIQGHHRDRAAINAQINEVYSTITAKFGIPKVSMTRAIKDMELDTDDLKDRDAAYFVARSAMGKPIQVPLFMEDDVKKVLDEARKLEEQIAEEEKRSGVTEN